MRESKNTFPPSSAPSKRRVLLVEDEELLRRAYGRILRSAGFSVEEAADGRSVIDALDERSFDVLMSDITMPGASGIDLLRAVRARDPDLPVVLLTASADVKTAVEAVEHGALRYLIKPVEKRVLCDAAEEGVALRALAKAKQRAFDLYGRLADEAVEHEALAERFERALEGLTMAYQPIVSLTGRYVLAHEALVRTSEASLRSPPTLFAAAERLGRIFDLGRAIRGSVANVIEGTDAGAGVFVNLHPRDLLDEDIYRDSDPLAAIATRVTLEITERGSLEEIPDLRARLSSLRALGYRLAVDDLGAGYSGLSAFAQIRPDVVKLDMSLTRGIDGDGTKQKLVRTMSDLCQDLGTTLVVEGVETREELAALQRLGCDIFQGYLFAKPAAPFPAVRWDAGD